MGERPANHIDDWTPHTKIDDVGQIYLTGGQLYSIRLEYQSGDNTAIAETHLLWETPLANGWSSEALCTSMIAGR